MKKPLLLLFVTLLFAGCQGAPVVQQSAEKLAPTNGYVYVSLPKFSYYKGITVRSLKTKEEHQLAKRSDPGITAYGLWLPAGKYVLSGWSNYELKDYPAFEVAPGRITDLGSLIPVNIGGHELVILPIRHPEVADEVSKAATGFAKYLRSQQPLTWSMQRTPTPVKLVAQASGLGLVVDIINVHAHEAIKPSINKELKATKTIPEFFRLALTAIHPEVMEPAADKDGNQYYGADLGQVRVRYKIGNWGALSTGSLKKITAVEAHGHSIFAGAENGKLRRTTDNGKSWQTVLTLGDKEVITDIDKVSTGWILMTLVKERLTNGQLKIDESNVYFSANDSFSNLKHLKKVKFKVGTGLLPEVTGKEVNGIYYLSAFPELYRLDLASMKLEPLKLPTEITSFSVSANEKVISIFRSKGIFSKLFLSTDKGKSWKEYNTPPYHFTNIHFTSAKKARTSRWSAGAFKGNYEILDYDAAENHWKLVSEAPDSCIKMLWDTRNEPAFCVTRGGSILAYNDKEWQVEYSNQ